MPTQGAQGEDHRAPWQRLKRCRINKSDPDWHITDTLGKAHETPLAGPCPFPRRCPHSAKYPHKGGTLLPGGVEVMAIKFGVKLATQKTNISSSLFHYVPRMARCAASQPHLLAGPLDAGPLRAPAIQRGSCHAEYWHQGHDTPPPDVAAAAGPA